MTLILLDSNRSGIKPRALHISGLEWLKSWGSTHGVGAVVNGDQEVGKTVLWQDVRDELHGRLGEGVGMLWPLLYAAQTGMIGLALMLPLDDSAGR